MHNNSTEVLNASMDVMVSDDYNLSLRSVLDRMKPVSQTSFRDHVAGKHEDRDKGFESEYQV